MSVNLLDMLTSSVGSPLVGQASKFLGESESGTRSAVGALLPALLGGMSQKAATPSGAADLFKLVTGPNIDTGLLGNLAGMLTGGSNTSSLLSLGSSLASSLFGGDKVGGLVSTLASLAGIKPSSATSLLGLATPLVFSFIKKYVTDNKLDSNGLATVLRDQRGHVEKAGLDSRLASLLGLGPAAAAYREERPAQRVAAPPPVQKSGFGRWLPWIIGAIAALLLWQFLSKPTPAPTPTPTATAPATTAPAPAAPVAATGLPVSVFFETAKFDIGADGKAKINAAAEVIKQGNHMVVVTGYTDRTGDLASNEELARNRAKAVKDALVAAGVAETRITLAKPVFVEIGVGKDAEARRVEISKAM